MSTTSLASQGLSAIFWGGAGSAVRIVLQLCAQIALARMLGPEQFGLFATALIALTICNYFSDIGLAYGLIQKPEVDADDIRFVFAWQIVLGCLMSGVLYAVAAPVAVFFGNPEVADVIEILSVACLVNALAALSTNLLKREMRFRTLQTATVTSYFFAYLLIGLGLAWSGAGVWALVAAFMSHALINLVMLYAATRHPIMPLWWKPDAPAMLGYGSTVLATNLVNWAVTSIDRAIVGRVFSTTAVAFYTNACNLVGNPAQTLAGILQPALFSVSARAQEDRERLRLALLAAIAACASLIAPVFVGIAAIADTMVLALYGPAWKESAALLRPIALAMPCLVLFSLATPSLWVSGKTRREFLLQLPVALVAAGVFWSAGQVALEAVAWAFLLMYLVRAGLILAAAAHTLALDLRDIAAALRGGMVLCLLCGLALASADALLATWGLTPVLRLCACIVLGGLVLAGAIVAMPHLLHPALQRLLSRLQARLPAVPARHLRRILERGNS